MRNVILTFLDNHTDFFALKNLIESSLPPNTFPVVIEHPTLHYLGCHNHYDAHNRATLILI